MLEQMERALYAEDPKFASALEGSGLRTSTRRRMYQAVPGFLIGIGLLMAGMVTQRVVVSVVGFLVMLGCAALAVASWRRLVRPAQGTADPAGRRPRRRSGVMNRIEARWQRRRDEQQGQGH
jgi:hypothetical protein